MYLDSLYARHLADPQGELLITVAKAGVRFFSMQRGASQSVITTKGQVTIPKPIRDHLGLEAGDKVKYFIHGGGSVVLLPTRPISSLRGILKKPRRKPVTIEAMREAVLAGASERFRRSRQR